MYVGSYNETSHSLELFSFDDIPDLPPIPAPRSPVVRLPATKISAVKDKINPIAIENLQQNSLKRKRQEEPEQPSKRTKLEDLKERIKRHQNLTPLQGEKLLGRVQFLIDEYYDGSNPDQVHQFISGISNREHKIGLVAWMECVKYHTSILRRTLDMLSKDPSEFNDTIRGYFLITDELPKKLQSLSQHLRRRINKKPTREYKFWASIEDKKIHEAHIEAHKETRKDIQKEFENAYPYQKNDVLNYYLDSIIKISYCQLCTKEHYSLEKIRATFIKINYSTRLILLTWMLYFTKIDTVRLIILLVKYNHLPDKVLVKSLKKIIYTTEKQHLFTFRQKLKRLEDEAICDSMRAQSTGKMNMLQAPPLPPITAPTFRAPSYPFYAIPTPFPVSFYPNNYFPQFHPLPPPIQPKQLNAIQFQ